MQCIIYDTSVYNLVLFIYFALIFVSILVDTCRYINYLYISTLCCPNNL